MRARTDKPKLIAFMKALGESDQWPGRVYIVGGSTALLLGIRDQTIDINLKLDPEPKGAFESIADLKERLGVNVELASPDLFLPALPGWHGRSEFIAKFGEVEFFHYDFYAQALAKILRGHGKDLEDARGYVALGKVDASELDFLFQQVLPGLVRYPGVSVPDFENRVRAFIQETPKEHA